jgi:hypothetical protein
MDGDARLDMLLGTGDGDVQLWRAVGARGEIRFERDTTFVVKSYPQATPAAADLFGSGRLDLVIGTLSGGVRLLRR